MHTGTPANEVNARLQRLEREIRQLKKNAEASMEKAEWYRQMFEKSGAASILIETDMTISMANAEFEKLSGYTKSEIEGKMKWSAFIAPSDIDRMMQYHMMRRNPQAPAPPEEYECRVIDKSGRDRHILIKVGMITDTDLSIASFMDITDLKNAEAALKVREASLREENIRLKTSIRDRYRFGDIIGKSAAMQRVYDQILQAAASDANVTIHGESGTGKELVANAIHRLGRRKAAPFVVVNCGAVPETLFESEFFGYKKGAFTGAAADTPGYLDTAAAGTLFLDEIAEMRLTMQVKLLRVADGASYTPVGGKTAKSSDFRIIGATHEDLLTLVKTGRMREDFFYRIHVIPINLPPLRERKEDLPLLIEHFLSRAKNSKRPVITGKIMDAINAYDWPGNVRELQNTLRRYATLGRLELIGERLTADTENAEAAPPYPYETGTASNGFYEAVRTFEKNHIVNALVQHQYHRSRTARALGMSRRNLYKKIKTLGIETP